MKIQYLKTPVIITTILSLLATSCVTVKHIEVVPITPSTSISSASHLIKPGLKRKVAIARFTNETLYGKSFLLDGDQDRMRHKAVDILSAKLHETGRFIMLERADLSKIDTELSLEGLQSLKNKADYLIIGSITEFGRKEVSDVSIFSRVKKQIAFAKVHVRLVDVATGQIIYSEEGEGEAFSEAGTVLGMGSKAGYDGTLNDKVLEAAITNLSSRIIQNLLAKPWKSYILGLEDHTVIIAGGRSQNVKQGDVFNLVLEGACITNPQTNMPITLPGHPIGKLKVFDVIGNNANNEVSLAHIIEGDLSTYQASNDFSKIIVVEAHE